jgi:ribosome-associated protein
MSEEHLVVELNHQPIELCKLLKIANLVSGGGEAKIVISEGYVLLNGEVEFQKRKKVYHEDVIEFNGDVVQVIIVEGMPEATSDNMIENTINSSVSNIIDSDEGQSFSGEVYQEDFRDDYTENTQKSDKTTNQSSKKNKKKKNKERIEQSVPFTEAPSAVKKRKPISF